MLGGTPRKGVAGIMPDLALRPRPFRARHPKKSTKGFFHSPENSGDTLRGVGT